MPIMNVARIMKYQFDAKYIMNGTGNATSQPTSKTFFLLYMSANRPAK
jgi:hypothetical protein